MVVELGSGEWLDANRARWDELVPLHVASEFYDLAPLEAGHGELFSVEEAELAAAYPEGLEGKRILHLQCHFGADTLALAQRGAEVVGIDFSKPAVLQARELAARLEVPGDELRPLLHIGKPADRSPGCIDEVERFRFG